MKKKLVTMVLVVALSAMFVCGTFAASIVTGNLDVYDYILPISTDKAVAYTMLKTPSRNHNNCESQTVVKIYNGAGDYKKDTYHVSGAMTWDLPLNAGAKASIRNAKRAEGTHKALSADTNYKWVSTKNTKWSK